MTPGFKGLPQGLGSTGLWGCYKVRCTFLLCKVTCKVYEVKIAPSQIRLGHIRNWFRPVDKQQHPTSRCGPDVGSQRAVLGSSPASDDIVEASLCSLLPSLL